MIKLLNQKLKEEIVFEIGVFTILWSELEKKYFDNNCYPDKIMDFNLNIDQDLLDQFREMLQDGGDYYEMIEVYIIYDLFPENSHKFKTEYNKIIKDFLTPYEFYEGDKFHGALFVIYSIRNNLMHGLKNIDELNDQIDLFKHVNKILTAMLEVK